LEGIFGVKIHIFERLESTQITAKEMALSGAEHGTVVIAEEQTAGRGRYGKAFFSPRGCGLYMSVILRSDKVRLSEPTLLTAFAAVSVCEAVEAAAGKTARIKWVNDIFIDGKKVCGILTEAVTDGDGKISFFIVGIGINTKEPENGYPQDISGIAGSADADIDPSEIASRILSTAESCNEGEMRKKYKERLFQFADIKLRPHHLLCIQNFRGFGYSDGFTQNMAELAAWLRCEPDTAVDVVSAADVICAKCPKKLVGDLCEAEMKVKMMDEKVLAYFDIENGRYVYNDVIGKIKAGMTAEIAEDICGGCEWYADLCKKLAAWR
jgi:biotin-[acetyl-CoA-carboxylase] ligase BirA-like protein